MKGSCTLVASALAAASTVAMASSGNRDVTSTNQGKSVNSKEKYAPRFDGLRFIETLVTAHR